MTEAERQVKVLEALPKDASRIRVSDLVKKLKMSPRKVNIHLEKLAGKGLVDFEYFPGNRAPIRLVWLTRSNGELADADLKIAKRMLKNKKRVTVTSSQRQKIKNKVKEILN
jgi:DNA-binding MarR family transcriptional regulator